MAAQQSQGIQTLLEAEKEAAKIVSKARTYRTQKLKDARSEAAKEIDELKAKKDGEYQKFKKEHEGTQSSTQTQVQQETEKELKDIQAHFDKQKDDVVQKLLDRVVDVTAEMHRNAVKVE
ncbi:unnamed protein product [Parajaminaea phylloscopi]